MRVLHATEAMGGGIISVLESFERRQTEQGIRVSIFYTRRVDTPSRSDLASRFSRSSITEFSGGGRVLDLLRFTVSLWSACNSDDYDIIHLHSSFAGALGRAAYAVSRRRAKIFYSPHGFSFLRQNVSRLSRTSTALAERLLSRVGSGLVLTCESERELAKSVLNAPRAYVVQTGVDPNFVHARPVRSMDSRSIVTVAMIGRAVYQKAPWRFAEVARQLEGSAKFRWYGANPTDPGAEWLADSPVELVGWLSPNELEEEMSRIDILVFATLWEGMPYSLIMSQARGIPAVVSDVVGNRDSVKDGVTGFVTKDDDCLVAATGRLIDDVSLRARMSAAALEWATMHLTDAALGVQSRDIYLAAM